MFEKLAEFWDSYGELSIIILVILMTLVIVLFAISESRKGRFTSKVITNGAIAIALATVLNLIILYSQPNGGSVTLGRLVPLLVFAYIYGPKRGFIIGAIYGIIDFIAKPYFLNVVQLMLDYILPFSCVGFAGLKFFKKDSFNWRSFAFILGAGLTGLARFLFSTIAGVLYYLPGQWIASMAYNSVLLIDIAVCILFIFILTRSKSFNILLDKQSGNVSYYNQSESV